MRKLLNRLLAGNGYRVERISRFERQVQELLQLQRPFRFVQIGANDGVRFDDLFPIATRHPCSGVVVEPLPDMFERLQANYADYPSIIAINKAIHADAVSVPIYRLDSVAIGRYPGWATGIASFDKEHLLRHSISQEDIAAHQVECLTLMTLLENTHMLDADLLVIDTEGYDGAILRMLDLQRCRPYLIRFEHKNLPAQERTDLALYLAAGGYQVAPDGQDTVAWLRTKK